MAPLPDNVPKMDPLRRVGEDQKLPSTPGSPGQGFDTYMQKAGKGAPESSKSMGVSPFDLAQQKAQLAANPNFDTLLTQTKSAQMMLGNMHEDLQTKNLKLRQAEKSMLGKKLKKANDYLKSANQKMGAPIAKPKESKKGGILGKFLDYISDGQNNLVSAQKQLMNLKNKGSSLQPADFLAIQVKMAHAQQEIEYASVMLGKAVDNLKTLMNIQL